LDDKQQGKNDVTDMNLKIKIKDKEYDVVVKEIGNEVTIIINNKEYIFNLDEPEENKNIPATQEVSARSGLSKKEIKAPLAGTVSDIFVSEGEEVKVGKKLLSLSAMKMENEIISEADGKIKQILLKKGDKAKEGEVLIIFY
jgi:glutaconyl-CoA/methylmalonyl-CoA decarboxylase subunit gamma